MRDIELKTSSGVCAVHCGGGAFDKYVPAIAARQCFVVTDRDVFAYFRNLLWEKFGDDFAVYIMPAGESGKSFSTLKAILAEMLKAGMKRGCTVVAFGGGVVGDVAGLAASLYMRGVRLVQIPTTLLAQVDSCVGGKTAVDFGGIKNLVGTFYQPEEVIADPRFLRTLAQREIRCGMGEIIKYAALDAEFFCLLKSRGAADPAFWEDMVYKCLSLKAKIVEEDEFDSKGIRKFLNAGHTTGHAFEEFYGKKSHGEYVLTGMFYEAYIAEKLGLGDKSYLAELRKLIFKVLKAPSFTDVRSAAELALNDKKNYGSDVVLVAPAAPGKCVEIKLPFDKYAEFLNECSENLKRSRKIC